MYAYTDVCSCQGSALIEFGVWFMQALLQPMKQSYYYMHIMNMHTHTHRHTHTHIGKNPWVKIVGCTYINTVLP